MEAAEDKGKASPSAAGAAPASPRAAAAVTLGCPARGLGAKTASLSCARKTPVAHRHSPASCAPSRVRAPSHLLGARAVGSSERRGGGGESSRSCCPRVEASGVRSDARLALSPDCARPSPPVLPSRPSPARPDARKGCPPCPASGSPAARGGKLRPGVGTCAELQAGAVAARAAAARGGRRARAIPDDGGEGRGWWRGGGRRRRRRSPQVALGRGGRARWRRRGGGGGRPAGPGGVSALRLELLRRRRRLAAADGDRGVRREGRRGRRRPDVRQLHQGGSVVALGQRRSLAGERLEDAVGAALLVDFGDAGPLLRRLHLLLHPAPRGWFPVARPLPAGRRAPRVPPPPARRLCPSARVWEGVCLCLGRRRRRRHCRLSPRLA